MTAGAPGPDLLIDDAALVRAPRWVVDARLGDVSDWSRWWPGLTRLSGEGGDVHHLQVATVRPWRVRRRLRLAVRPWGRRVGQGTHVVLAGDVTAAVEFWFADDVAGTVVHHLARVDPASRAAASWRPTVRAALWALDDRLVHEVRQAVLPTPPST